MIGGSMEPLELSAFCKKLIERSNFAYLTTLDQNGEPETRAMLNLYNREQHPSLKNTLSFPPYDFYFTTNTSSEKMKQIEKNDKSCVYYVIESEWLGVMFAGRIEIVSDSVIKKSIWQDEWVRYYPGENGYQNEDYSVLKLTARYLKGWNRKEKFKFTIDQKMRSFI